MSSNSLPPYQIHIEKGLRAMSRFLTEEEFKKLLEPQEAYKWVKQIYEELNETYE